MLLHLLISSSGWQVARASPGSSGRKARTQPGQDTLPSQGHSHPHYCWDPDNFGTPVNPGHVFRTWEANRVRRENPRRRGENVPTPHSQWPWPGINFFFLIIMKRHLIV